MNAEQKPELTCPEEEQHWADRSERQDAERAEWGIVFNDDPFDTEPAWTPRARQRTPKPFYAGGRVG